jgi:hypothetical protein
MVRRVRTDRLRILADHLINGKLGQDKFDFGVIHEKNGCGSIGCAMGELPYVFSDDWILIMDYGNYYYPILRIPQESNWDYSSFEDVKTYFQISEKIGYHLFYPGHQIPKLSKSLSSDTSPVDVGKNILRYCKTLENKRENTNILRYCKTLENKRKNAIQL